MKLAVLITGQIRDEGVFIGLCQSIANSQHFASEIIFASWPGELAKGRSICDDNTPSLRMTYVDCGAPLAISSHPNPSIMSFVFQYQQIAAGISQASDDDTFVIRLRADMANPEIAGVLIEIINHQLGRKDLRERSLLIGGGSLCGLFFEDRILMLSPKHCKRLLALPLNHINNYNPRNIFPEFLFYSIASAASSDVLTYDFRYRRRPRKSKTHFTEYDFAYFGDGYEEYVQKFKNLFARNFIYLEDCVGDDPNYSAIKDRLPRFSNVYDVEVLYQRLDSDVDIYKREFHQWSLHSTEYAQAAASQSHIAADMLSTTRGEMLSCAKQVAYIDYLYNNAKNHEIAQLGDQINRLSFFKEEALEKLGCSLFAVGRKEDALKILVPLNKNGYEGFECLYYLCMLLKEKRQMGYLWEVARQFKELHTYDPRVVPHIRTQLGCDPDEFFEVVLKQNATLLDEIERQRGIADKAERDVAELNKQQLAKAEEYTALLESKNEQISKQQQQIGLLTAQIETNKQRYEMLLHWSSAYNQATYDSLSWKATWLLRRLGFGRPARPEAPDLLINGIAPDQ
ncbi:hypothetical protein ACLBXO_30435 [Methylobacterium sp. C33D]